MKKMFAAMTAALLMVALVSSTAFAGSGKWTIWAYDYTNTVPIAGHAANPHGGTIATFAFDQYNDQALLTSAANGYTKNGNLLGDTVTATFSITAPVGTTFTTYTDATCTDTTATVRLYFDTKLHLGVYENGVYSASLWWSINPVSISLADVFAAGPNGVTLSVAVTPANWLDEHGTNGSADVADFNAAASNVNQVGLSFGSQSCYAFGDGSASAGVMFNLLKFSTTAP
jgi:hypothetical protein